MERKVKGLMTRLSEIAILDENATLFEAVLEIGIARAEHPAASRCPAALRGWIFGKECGRFS